MNDPSNLLAILADISKYADYDLNEEEYQCQLVKNYIRASASF